jgi:hypothetical protein
VSRALTLAYITEDSISTKACQVPLLRCETVLFFSAAPKEGGCGGMIARESALGR